VTDIAVSTRPPLSAFAVSSGPPRHRRMTVGSLTTASPVALRQGPAVVVHHGGSSRTPWDRRCRVVGPVQGMVGEPHEGRQPVGPRRSARVALLEPRKSPCRTGPAPQMQAPGRCPVAIERQAVSPRGNGSWRAAGSRADHPGRSPASARLDTRYAVVKTMAGRLISLGHEVTMGRGGPRNRFRGIALRSPVPLHVERVLCS
jgi:hypothetical protein